MGGFQAWLSQEHSMVPRHAIKVVALTNTESVTYEN